MNVVSMFDKTFPYEDSVDVQEQARSTERLLSEWKICVAKAQDPRFDMLG